MIGGSASARDRLSRTMPAAFLGHGTPMNALDHNRYTQAWRAFGASMPRPRAILVVSAHWYINASAVTAMAQPRTIHDFYGFPDELFAVEYPAPGDPELADEIADLVKPTGSGSTPTAGASTTAPGRCSCTRSPTRTSPWCSCRSTPTKPFEDHLELGARLAPLRERGVLIVGSGNVVHNLGRIDWSRPDAGFDWTRRFDDDAATIMTSHRPSRRGSLDHHELRAGRADAGPLHPAAVRRRARRRGRRDGPRARRRLRDGLAVDGVLHARLPTARTRRHGRRATAAPGDADETNV